mgnify:CR=1 FL=1
MVLVSFRCYYTLTDLIIRVIVVLVSFRCYMLDYNGKIIERGFSFFSLLQEGALPPCVVLIFRFSFFSLLRLGTH